MNELGKIVVEDNYKSIMDKVLGNIEQDSLRCNCGWYPKGWCPYCPYYLGGIPLQGIFERSIYLDDLRS